MPFEKHFHQQRAESLADPNRINGDQGQIQCGSWG